MASREIEAGPLVAAGGGLALLVSLFLDWFDQFSAWTAFETLDLVLAALAIAAMASAAAPRQVPTRMLPVLGGVAFVIVASQLIDHPPVGIDRSTELGAWLGFGGTIAMLVGGVIAVARVSLAVNVSDRGGTPPAGTSVPPPAPASPPPGGATPPHGDPVVPPAPGPEDETQKLAE